MSAVGPQEFYVYEPAIRAEQQFVLVSREKIKDAHSLLIDFFMQDLNNGNVETTIEIYEPTWDPEDIDNYTDHYVVVEDGVPRKLAGYEEYQAWVTRNVQSPENMRQRIQDLEDEVIRLKARLAVKVEEGK